MKRLIVISLLFCSCSIYKTDKVVNSNDNIDVTTPLYENPALRSILLFHIRSPSESSTSISSNTNYSSNSIDEFEIETKQEYIISLVYEKIFTNVEKIHQKRSEIFMKQINKYNNHNDIENIYGLKPFISLR